VATAQLGSYGLSSLFTNSINQVLELMCQANICGKEDTYLRTSLTIQKKNCCAYDLLVE
jgi:hypothetical protein